jgi:hypothetical protein
MSKKSITIPETTNHHLIPPLSNGCGTRLLLRTIFLREGLEAKALSREQKNSNWPSVTFRWDLNQGETVSQSIVQAANFEILQVAQKRRRSSNEMA